MESTDFLTFNNIDLIIAQSYQAIGVIGFLLYMLAYFLLQIGKVEGSGIIYTLMNLSAAILVLISLIHEFNLASVLIQVAWILISIIGLIRFNLARSPFFTQIDI